MVAFVVPCTYTQTGTPTDGQEAEERVEFQLLGSLALPE
jgi:hypothetical protein